MGVWYTATFLALSVAVGLLAWFYARPRRVMELQAGARRPASPEPRRATGGLKDFWEVKNIRKSVLVLTGDRYRMVCHITAADFWLLSEAEQNNVEDALRGALRQLNYPVQFLVTSEAVDTRAAVEELRETAPSLPGALADMALARANWLTGLMQERAASARRAYVVLSYDTVKGFDHALEELQARANTLAVALAGAKIRLEPLSSEALVDLLAHLLNRGRAWRPSEAAKAGALCLYHVGERDVYEDEVPAA